jgi:hypothetical protein
MAGHAEAIDAAWEGLASAIAAAASPRSLQRMVEEGPIEITAPAPVG